jgi:hypothetical protein
VTSKSIIARKMIEIPIITGALLLLVIDKIG